MQDHGQHQQRDAEKYDSAPGFSKHYSRYVPPALQGPKALATFREELVNAVTCCEAVEQNPWNGPNAHTVIRQARQRQGHATVRAVSLPSQRSCSQQFMAFEANEDGHTTYIIAFRNDQECFNNIVSTPRSTPAAAKEVEKDNTFKVNKSMWWRAATMPLQSLPPQWIMGLRHQGHRLILTGFSVAGAVASVATLQLLEAENDISEQICCYTFGTPLQGDQNYANRINHKWVSNFYHVMMDKDQIPGVLTLISKVAENQQTKCNHVVGCIVKLLAVSAQVATSVAISSVAPGAGAIVQLSPNDLVKLGTDIKSLLTAKRNSPMPWPEYKFGGSLVLLYLPNMGPNSQSSGAQMTFVQLLNDGRVLEDVFSIQEKDITSKFELQYRHGLHQLKTFSQVINDLEDVRSAPAEKQHLSGRTRMDQISQSIDHININDGVKDGAGRVVKSTSSAAKPTVRCDCQPRVEDAQSSSSGYLYLLQPQFDTENSIEVVLDKHGNITIDVNGENMVLGMHVVYMVDGKEKLRIPCVENCLPRSVGNAEDPQKTVKQSQGNRPLRFITQGPKGLFFKEEDGRFIVQLAFGSKEVAANTVNIRMFDSLKEVQVAERFSNKHPSELIDLLLFWGVATAQAQCTAAYYGIKDNPRDAANIISKTITELSIVPDGFILLDRLLALVDTSHVPEAVLNKLPADMSQTLRSSTSNVKPNNLRTDMTSNAVSIDLRAEVNQWVRTSKYSVLSVLPADMSNTLRKTTSATKLDVIVPYFQADNESTSSWTFSGCFKRAIKPLLSKKMLSKKETAEKLYESLDEDIAGPKEMVRAYLNHQFKYMEYGKDFSVKEIRKWEDEKEVAQTLTAGTLLGGACLPVVNIPIVCAGIALDSDFVRNVGLSIGAPTGILLAGMAGAAWWLTFAALTPKKLVQKRPGLMADLMRTTHLADNWEKKLEAAAILFQRKIESPAVACKLEYELYQHLEKVRLPAGRFESSTDEACPRTSRLGAAAFLQLANFGLAGAMVHEIRRYLTKRKTALGLIGSTQAGKSTFASLAFKVDSNPGRAMDARTRALRHWPVTLPRSSNQFTLIDFPGSTDQAASNWCIRGQLLASVLVVVVSLSEINSSQAVSLVKMACEARTNDKEVAVLFCFTLADTVYESYKDDEAAGDEAEEMLPHSTARQLFMDNFDQYTEELIKAASGKVGHTDQMEYIRSNMHACCFRPKLQDVTLPVAQELESIKVKNVQWVKNWCEESLLAINK